MAPEEGILSRILTSFLAPLSIHRFINARRRILQPMLDSSCSETPKTKKKPAQNRPVQRFWPDSLASGVAQTTPSELAMSEGMSLQVVTGGNNGPGQLLSAVSPCRAVPEYRPLSLHPRFKAGKMAHWEKALATKPDDLTFDAWGGPTLTSCPLTSTPCLSYITLSHTEQINVSQ